MNTEIKEATDGDLKAICEIESSSFPDPWTEGIFKGFLNGKDAFFTLCVENVLAGYAVLGLSDEYTAELYNIAVHPSFKRQGLATLMFEEAKRISKEKKREKILLEVRASNAPAIAFYEKNGFKYDGIRKNYYSFPREDGILMSLSL